MIETRVLITNLWYVTIGDGLRTNCNAILLEREKSPLDHRRHRCMMRGFGTEAAWSVFDCALPTIDHELCEHPDALRIVGAPEIGLWRDASDRPIARRTFEWDSDDNERGHRFGEIWQALETSVAEHWHVHAAPDAHGAEGGPSAAVACRDELAMICNETINAARLGLRSAIQGVQEFDSSLTDREVLTLLVTVADVEGVPYAKRDQYDIKLYDEVRRRTQ